ncbi:MAG: peptide-methionine (S)-S-oxide reductase [Legionellales bacterium]|nr:peptide-methionine (S)-S-oxide reductase [Legionellales bacterium]|tara:strand:- start:2100 stop:2702 length:603 start_codon:yes stop_codon:yes gene_type:complete
MRFLVFLSILISVGFPMSNYAATNTFKTAIFAGGCFWCMQSDFDKVPGVVKTVVGYTGGTLVNPSYEQVSEGGTGHFEAIEVTYNPKVTNYKKLLNNFWHNVDPTDANGQFCDKGMQYRSAIFYANTNQQAIATDSKQQLLKTKRFKNIATLILPASTFYPAEAYHQDYYKKNPVRYKFYRYTCGRDKRLAQVWGQLSEK